MNRKTQGKIEALDAKYKGLGKLFEKLQKHPLEAVAGLVKTGLFKKRLVIIRPVLQKHYKGSRINHEGFALQFMSERGVIMEVTGNTVAALANYAYENLVDGGRNVQ